MSSGILCRLLAFLGTSHGNRTRTNTKLLQQYGATLLEIDGQQRNICRRDSADSTGLPQGSWLNLGEFLTRLDPQASNPFVIDPIGNSRGFRTFGAGNGILLSFDVPLVFQVGFDLLPPLPWEIAKQIVRQMGNAKVWPPQQLI